MFMLCLQAMVWKNSFSSIFADAEEKCSEVCHEEHVAPEPKEIDLYLLRPRQ